MKEFKLIEFVKSLDESIERMKKSLRNAPEGSKKLERLKGQSDVLTILERDYCGPSNEER